MADLPFRRTRLLVDRSLQRSLCAHFLGIGLFVLGVFTVGLFAPLLWRLVRGMPSEAEQQTAASVLLYMHDQVWFLVAGSFAFLAVWALRLSHRIAGPLVRYKRNLRLLAEGRLPPPLYTRRRDYLKEEVACLNAAVDGVRTRLAAVRAANARLRSAVGVLQSSTPSSREALAEARAAQVELERCLAAFTEAGDIDRRPAAARHPGATGSRLVGVSGEV